MARPAKGHEVLGLAKACLKSAKTTEELREAQAVVLPLDFGLSIEQTSKIIGKSVRWTTELRRSFIRRGGPRPDDSPTRGGRYRQNLSVEEEVEFLAPFFEDAKSGVILVAGPIKVALEARLGRKVALASVYNLLHRNGWRKLAPDKRNPKTNIAAQEEFKKNSQK